MRMKTDYEMSIIKDMIQFGEKQGFLYGGKVFKKYIILHPELSNVISKKQFMPVLKTYFDSKRYSEGKGWMDYSYGFKTPKGNK